MNKDHRQDIVNLIVKLQLALGESLVKAKKLKKLIGEEPELAHYSGSIEGLVKSLAEIGFLYRHNIADEIRSGTR